MLHTTLTSASFIASTGFHLSSATLTSASDVSQHLLATLDAILGSTESSRAIASIITLIRREFRPQFGDKDEQVGVADLLVGLSGMALLQRWCWKRDQKEMAEQGAEEVVFDIVILDGGVRADVVRVRQDQNPSTKRIADHSESTDFGIPEKRYRPSSFISTDGTPQIIEAVRRGQPPDESYQNELAASEAELRQRIMAIIPENANVSITTETVTTKTITVEMSGIDPPDISTPPGLRVIEENAHTFSERESDNAPGYYRVVYQTTRNQLRRSDAEREGDEDVLEIDDGDQGPFYQESTLAPSQSTPSAVYQTSPMTSPEPEEPPQLHDHGDENAYFDHDEASSPPSKIPVKQPQGPLRATNVANQKRLRQPPNSPVSPQDAISNRSSSKNAVPKGVSPKHSTTEKGDKKSSLRRAFKKGTSGSNLTNLWNKDGSSSSENSSQRSKVERPPWGSSKTVTSKPKSITTINTNGRSNQTLNKDLPNAPQRGNPNYFSSRDLGMVNDIPRSPSRASYYSIHGRRRDSLVSQTDTFSIQSVDPSGRPSSPNQFRTHVRQQTLGRAHPDLNPNYTFPPNRSPEKPHHRSKSHVPSIYTLATNGSQTSLALARPPATSALDSHETIVALTRTGRLPGIFPSHHFVRNISRFIRFASASYGSHFLRVMGIASQAAATRNLDTDILHHHEHHSFSKHTGLPPSTILVSSFVDPQGGTNATGETETGVPLIHFVTLDHASKAVVLTCRGTLGFEDVLTDMTCDYDDIFWRGKAYKVHKGMHASARRLLTGGGGRIMATIKAALEEFPDYGFVLCGHSLGGGVTTLLAILLAEPDNSPTAESAFLTANPQPRTPLLLTNGSVGASPAPLITLPAGRPIHVYAYGPPATLSPSLRKATRNLITTLINGQDLVPYLSLGVLRDLQSVALAFKNDTSGAKREVRARVWEGLTSGVTGRFYGGVANQEDGDGDEDVWSYAALKSLRAGMLAPKLMPPGEVFVIETTPVLQRDAFTKTGEEVKEVGRPATRAVLRYVRDVERRFGEVRYGKSMLGDHSPGRYESSLRALASGCLED